MVNFVDGADVRVVQGPLYFATKRARCLPRSMASSGQKLQGDGPLELSVPGLVDDPHAALAELFENLVVRDRLADHERSLIYSSIRLVGGPVDSLPHAALIVWAVGWVYTTQDWLSFLMGNREGEVADIMENLPISSRRGSAMANTGTCGG